MLYLSRPSRHLKINKDSHATGIAWEIPTICQMLEIHGQGNFLVNKLNHQGDSSLNEFLRRGCIQASSQRFSCVSVKVFMYANTAGSVPRNINVCAFVALQYQCIDTGKPPEDL